MRIQAIEAFIASWNQNAAPFEWTKKEVKGSEPAKDEEFLLTDLRN